MTKTIFFRSLYILMWIDYVFTLRILGVFPIPSHSHFIGGFRVMKELADRGHDVTLISSFPQKIPIKNLKDVALIPSTEGTDGEFLERVICDFAVTIAFRTDVHNLVQPRKCPIICFNISSLSTRKHFY